MKRVNILALALVVFGGLALLTNRAEASMSAGSVGLVSDGAQLVSQYATLADVEAAIKAMKRRLRRGKCALPAVGTRATQKLCVKRAMRRMDRDQDGIKKTRDNCPQNYNPAQEDTDSDGVGNACDNAPLVANNDQADQDGDNIGDVVDNCPTVSNNSQEDDDHDGFGKACDPDGDPSVG